VHDAVRREHRHWGDADQSRIRGTREANQAPIAATAPARRADSYPWLSCDAVVAAGCAGRSGAALPGQREHEGAEDRRAQRRPDVARQRYGGRRGAEAIPPGSVWLTICAVGITLPNPNSAQRSSTAIKSLRGGSTHISTSATHEIERPRSAFRRPARCGSRSGP